MSVTILDTDPRLGPSILFAEDFDRPPIEEPAPEPEIIEPTFTVAEMEACRQEAWRAGEQSGAAAAEATAAAAARRSLAAIAAMLAETRAEAARAAEDAAIATTRLLFDALAVLFPTLTARLGENEVRAVIATVLPALRQDPHPTIRVAPALAEAVTGEIERLEPGLPTQVRIIADDTMAPGDIRVSWRKGSAERDGRAMWREIAAILGQAGLPVDRIAAQETNDVQ